MSYIQLGMDWESGAIPQMSAPPPPPAQPTDSGSWYDPFLDFGGSVLDHYGETQKQQGIVDQQNALIAQQQYGGGSMPKWVLPVAIGGGALILALAMKRKR